MIKMSQIKQAATEAASSLPRLKDVSTRRDVRRAAHELRCIAEAASGRRGLPPDALEWLRDNLYMSEREFARARFELTGVSRLPRARTLNQNHTRVLVAARALIRSSERQIGAAQAEEFLKAFTSARELTERELAVFPAALIIAALSALADECSLRRNASARRISALFKSLRVFGSSDFSGALERASRVERVLLRDPAGVYPEMSRGSRALYRAEIARQAEKAGADEEETALYALRLAERNKAHVGEYIMPRPGSGAFYPIVIAAASLLAALLFGILSGNIWLLPLNLIAVSELIRQIADYVITRLAVSRGIPRLELRGGVPAHARTLAVIAVLLTSKESAEAAASLLERYSILNRDAGENLIFGLLADLPEAKTAETPDDAEIKAAARRAIDKLNARSPGRFFLFLREREESRRDRVFRGRERKRGAILQLMRELTRRGAGNALVRDGRMRPSSAVIPPLPVRARGVSALCALTRDLTRRGAGNALARDGRMRPSSAVIPPFPVRSRTLNQTSARLRALPLKYLIVLDEDTELRAGSARELIGAMLHPLNRAVVDPKSRVVTRGHGILQPRVVTDLNASVRTEFARAFSGGGGGDVYGGSRGELYQDISGSSGFIGKGIIDVDAYLACLDGRFPAERVLSHDLLEGAYLCCGFAGDIELSDGFPASAAPYYGRLHRWTRGDWQNAPWLLPRVRGESGERERNPLKHIDKWRIFDNLRRSLLPPCACALILAAALDARFLPEAFAAALSLVFGHMLAAVNAVLRGKLQYRRRFSFIPEAFSSRLAAAFTRLLLLPIEAAVCLSAAVTAIFRMAFTKRNLLQWITAAASEPPPQKNTPRRVPLRLSYLACLLPGFAAVVIAAATLSLPAAALAAVWCFAPVIAARMGREKPEPATPERNREYLLKAASGAYDYFSDFLTPENNFLPPDNFQPDGFRDERPSAPARYTSPTNIGLALLAPVTALELGLISKGDALKTISAALGSVELLSKWRGHLYNWYDTEAMAPREPRFVSTVDSGNFAACLIALRESLTEYGESELAQRAEQLYRAMDFSPLYDKKRRLFLIGLDGSDNKNVYDLLASEAMLTSYIAVARGDAPVRHWRALSRAAARSGAYLGPASWSGSVFEYLMPMLFLPYFSGSLLRESANFCVYAHKKAARLSCWGNSESAYYELDGSGRYRYKAHGVPELALKRDMGRDFVVAPYASFLALEIDPDGAYANLRRLEALGAYGKYGFIDAVDFTRAGPGGSPSPVRIYMAHHIGMSLAATANYLENGVLRRRFMRDREMGAFSALLKERVPAVQTPPGPRRKF